LENKNLHDLVHSLNLQIDFLKARHFNQKQTNDITKKPDKELLIEN